MIFWLSSRYVYLFKVIICYRQSVLNESLNVVNITTNINEMQKKVRIFLKSTQ